MVAPPPVGETVIEESEVRAVRGIGPRRVNISLPPGNDRDRPRPYPLLIALDGQTMSQWRLRETLSELVVAWQIEPVVAAAVPASAERLEESGTVGELDFAGRGRSVRVFQELLADEVLS